MNAPSSINATRLAEQASPTVDPSPGLDRSGWIIAPGWGDRLRSAGAIDWFELAGDPRAEAVKANPNRQVWRVRLADELLYVKVFGPGGIADRFRGLVRKPAALLEWRAGVYAQSAGVPCVGLVACGVRKRGLAATESVLITRAVDGAIGLPEAWRRLGRIDQPQERRRATLALTGAVAELLARAHQGRFGHRDGHPGNILIRGADTLSPSALYVDLYGASMGADISEAIAAAGIAQLDQWFQRHAGRTTRLRFVKEYLARRFGDQGVTPAGLRRWTRLVGRAGRRNAADLYAKRDRRVWRRGKYFATLRLGDGWRATVPLVFRNRDEFPAPVHPDRTSAAWGELLGRHLQNPDEAAGPDGGIAAEHRRASGVGQRLGWALGASPARRAFAAGHGLRHRDVPCAWPVALLERRGVFGVSECHLLTERRPDCRPLSDLIAGPGEDIRGWANSQWRRAALESVGRLLGEATLRGVRWDRPRWSALWIDCPGDPASRPRALFGRFEGITFGRTVDASGGAQAALAVAQELTQCWGLEQAEGGMLLAAFRNRLGGAFERVGGWPET